MDAKNQLPLAELKRLGRMEQDADRRRLWIVILRHEGWTASAVAMAVGLSRQNCQRWVGRYSEAGLARLDDRRRRGPRVLPRSAFLATEWIWRCG